MPADSTGISDTDAKKIAEMVIKMSIEGSEKALTQLGKIDKSFRTIQTAAQQAGSGISTAFTSAISPLTKVAALVGAGLGFSQGIKAVEGYSKSIISLSAQMNKYGQGTGDAINKVEKLSRTLSLTRSEAVGLASQFEKTFHTGNLNSSAVILEKIKNVVGSNAEAIAKMSGELGAMTMKYPTLQAAMEKLETLDKERLRNHMMMAVSTGQMSLQEARGLQDFINQNKQLNASDQKKQDQHKKYVESMQELRTSFEEISLIIGQAIMPAMTRFSEIIKNNIGSVKTVIGWIEKGVEFFLGWGKYIAVAAIGLGSLAGILAGILQTAIAIKAISSMFPAGGAAASAAAGKAAAASAASAHAAAEKACGCSSSVGSKSKQLNPNMNYGDTTPKSAPQVSAPKVGLASKLKSGVSGALTSARGMDPIAKVAIVAASAEAGYILGKGIAKWTGAEGTTKDAISVAGGAAGGAAAGFAVGGPLGAAIGGLGGGIMSLIQVISENRAKEKKEKGEAKRSWQDTKNTNRQQADTGEISEETRKARDAIAHNAYTAVRDKKKRTDKDKREAGTKNQEDEEAARQGLRRDDLRKADVNASISNQLEGRYSGTDKKEIKIKKRALDTSIEAENKGKVFSAEEISNFAKAGKLAENGIKLSQKGKDLLFERTQLELSVDKVVAHQVEMADIANKKYEIAISLKQVESSILDIMIQKTVLLGRASADSNKIREQANITQRAAIAETEARVGRIKELEEDTKSETDSKDQHNKDLAALREQINANKEKRDYEETAPSKDPAKIADLTSQITTDTDKLAAKKKDVAASELKIAGNMKEIKTMAVELDKLFISIMETHYRQYEASRLQYDIIKNTTMEYSNMASAIAEQMQLKGNEDPAAVGLIVAESRNRAEKQLTQNLKAQAEIRKLMTNESKEELKSKLKAQIQAAYKNKTSDADKANMADEIKASAEGVESGKEQALLEQKLFGLKKEEAGITKQTNEQSMISVNLYNKKIELANSEVAITESMIGLYDQMGMGVGASVQMRMQAVGQVGKSMELQDQKIAEIKAKIANGTLSAQEGAVLLNKEEQTRIQLLTKQFELSKALRDGWTSALTSQSIASGRVTKIMMTKQSNLATAIGEMGSAISSVTGTNKKGAGARSSSRFGVDAAGNATFTDPGNASYQSDHKGMGGEVDMATMKKITDMQARGDRSGAASLYRQVGDQQMAARMSGNGSAYGAGVAGASAEIGFGARKTPRVGATGNVLVPQKSAETTPPPAAEETTPPASPPSPSPVPTPTPTPTPTPSAAPAAARVTKKSVECPFCGFKDNSADETHCRACKTPLPRSGSTPSPSPASASSGGSRGGKSASGTPITLTFNVNTEAQLNKMMEAIKAELINSTTA